MDKAAATLIADLCARAGMLMEDASVTAVTIGALDERELAQALDQLNEAVGQIAELIRAARALAR